MIDFLKLFKEATVLTPADSLFKSARAAAAKERAPSVGSTFCVGSFLRLLCYMMGLKNSRQFFIQSEVKPKPIVTHLHAFSHALSQLPVITSSFDWFTVLCGFLWLARVITLVLVL